MKIPVPNGGGSGSGSDECTAKAEDILEGKTAIYDGSNDEAAEGSMKDYSGTTQEGSAALDTSNSRLQLTIPNTGKYDNAAKLYTSYSNLASLGGLTAAKIATGNTVFGITGTYTGVGTAAAAQVLSGYTFSNSSSSGISGSMSDRSGSTTSVTATLDSSNSRVRMTIPNNGYYNTSAYLYTSYSSLASVIGLTADKMTTDKSCLGITGTQNYIYEYSNNPIVWQGTLSFTTSTKEIDSAFTITDGGWVEFMIILDADFDSDWIDGTYAYTCIGKPNAQTALLMPDGVNTGLFIRLSRESDGVVTIYYYGTASRSNVAVTIRKICYTNCDINSNF